MSFPNDKVWAGYFVALRPWTEDSDTCSRCLEWFSAGGDFVPQRHWALSGDISDIMTGLGGVGEEVLWHQMGRGQRCC